MEAKAVISKWVLSASLIGLLVASAALASPCNPVEPVHSQKQYQAWTRLTAPSVVLSYRWIPDTAAVGQPLGIELVACPQPNATAPEHVRVDARMPAHGHGMNYRPKATQIADGHYRFDGLILHMPGQWQLIFDVTQAGQRTRLTDVLELTK